MKQMKMNIIAVPRLLDLIGASMYSNYPKAIGELIINGYDADAEKVVVEVNDKVVIIDNGSGMTPNELQESFLKFGGAQKSEIKKTKRFNRDPVGNKGIGKWAGLGISKRMIVITEKEGIRSRIMIDYDDLLKYKDIKDIEINCSYEKCDPSAHGTKVMLTKLIATNINVKRLVEYLSRELPMDGQISYYVNGKQCKRTDIKADMKRKIHKELPTVGLITGELIIATKRLDNITPGIITRVRGRQVGKPYLYEVPYNTNYASYSHLITGEVRADGLNDYIKTDREGFKEDSEAYQEYYKFLNHELCDLVKEKYRSSKMKKSLKDFEEKAEMLSHISKIFNKIQKVEQEISKGGHYKGETKNSEDKGYIKTSEPFTEKRGENRLKRTNPVGITDKKIRRLARLKPKIGHLILGHKNYKVVISPNGVDDKECRIDDELYVITINEDHPSYFFAKNTKNKAFIEYQLFKAIASAYSYKISDTSDRFYELLDGYVRTFVKENKRRYHLNISYFGDVLKLS